MNRSSGFYRITAACAAAAILASACQSTTELAEDPPVLPPDVSMVIDFSDFASGQPAPGSATAVNQVGLNWTRAAVAAGLWNIALTVTMVVPVAAFLATANQQPVRQQDGSWTWTFDFNVGAVQHTARLEGRFAAPGVQWEMFLTKQGEYENFRWYTGSSNLPATEGQWNLNLHSSDPTPFLRIDWNRDFATNTGEIRYTNVVPGASENGGYINYGIVAGPFDAFYEIFNAQNGNLTSIEWSRSTQEGRIRAEHAYGDTDWHCWNSILDDIACP